MIDLRFHFYPESWHLHQLLCWCLCETEGLHVTAPVFLSSIDNLRRHIWQRDLLLLELFIGLSRRRFKMKLILIVHFRALFTLLNWLSPRTQVKGYLQRRDWTVLAGFLSLYKPFIEHFSGRPSAFTIHKSMFFFLV